MSASNATVWSRVAVYSTLEELRNDWKISCSSEITVEYCWKVTFLLFLCRAATVRRWRFFGFCLPIIIKTWKSWVLVADKMVCVWELHGRQLHRASGETVTEAVCRVNGRETWGEGSSGLIVVALLYISKDGSRLWFDI